MNEPAGRVWGYYADGYFDRRAIVDAIDNAAASNSAVSVSTKDAAYIGTLFFNAANGNRSLFMPAGGSLGHVEGVLNNSGNNCRYWSSSSSNTLDGWHLSFDSGSASQNTYYRSSGLAVRCVVE
jgi:hypothetical protein